jgi:dGTPase
MNSAIRERTERLERQTLSPFAAKSCETKGRRNPQPLCDIRTEFQRDRDRIVHCKSFRRLMHKTQVFISTEGDHYRTRLTHTLEVAQIARTIARALRLNEDLTEAIALGHDIGHTPFGHTGEDALNALLPGGFAHNQQSVRLAEKLEENGAGLNLTAEVLDGILNHRTSGNPATMEGQTARIADKIAYINHDIDDAIEAGILHREDLPKEPIACLGHTKAERIDTLIRGVVTASADKPAISMPIETEEAMRQLRAFLFETVYRHTRAPNERDKIVMTIRLLFTYFIEHISSLPSDCAGQIRAGETEARVVADYIAGMTDRFAMKTFCDLFVL